MHVNNSFANLSLWLGDVVKGDFRHYVKPLVDIFWRIFITTQNKILCNVQYIIGLNCFVFNQFSKKCYAKIVFKLNNDELWWLFSDQPYWPHQSRVFPFTSILISVTVIIKLGLALRVLVLSGYACLSYWYWIRSTLFANSLGTS